MGENQGGENQEGENVEEEKKGKGEGEVKE